MMKGECWISDIEYFLVFIIFRYTIELCSTSAKLYGYGLNDLFFDLYFRHPVVLAPWLGQFVLYTAI